MSEIANNLNELKSILPEDVRLIAVSKTKPLEAIMEAYEAGQRIFGENKVQEMVMKAEQLPDDIEWHMIGHLQRNKVKYMSGFVHLIHGVDSFRLLKEIEKQAQKASRVQKVLLQVHIAEEESKFGFNEAELLQMIDSEEFTSLQHIEVKGLMGMASFTDDSDQVRKEFSALNQLYQKLQSRFDSFDTLSMGMSGDYPLAIECGSNMIRVGTAIFGKRNYPV